MKYHEDDNDQYKALNTEFSNYLSLMVRHIQEPLNQNAEKHESAVKKLADDISSAASTVEDLFLEQTGAIEAYKKSLFEQVDKSVAKLSDITKDVFQGHESTRLALLSELKAMRENNKSEIARLISFLELELERKLQTIAHKLPQLVNEELSKTQAELAQNVNAFKTLLHAVATQAIPKFLNDRLSKHDKAFFDIGNQLTAKISEQAGLLGNAVARVEQQELLVLRLLEQARWPIRFLFVSLGVNLLLIALLMI